MNEVRIIGGKWKRRKLTFPPRGELRPTPDRTRETLFNWLVGRIDGTRCLDLFAGSGALGFEALSRGAAHCTFVERDPHAVRALHTNRERLAATDCSIVKAEALAYLRKATSKWDIVFLDPPFDAMLISDCLALLLSRSLLADDARIYVEHRRTATPDLAPFTVLKSTRAGDSAAVLLAP